MKTCKLKQLKQINSHLHIWTDSMDNDLLDYRYQHNLLHEQIDCVILTI